MKLILPMDEDILPPSDDYIFKALLTGPKSKPALMGLISAVIGRKVSDIVIRNNELPKKHTEEKGERLDVNCTIDDGSQVNVEMQGSAIAGPEGGRLNLVNKSVYYLADMHSTQSAIGVDYADMVRSYQITFSAHNIFNWPEFCTEASLRGSNGKEISDQINLVIIELGKLGGVLKKPVEQMTMLERWSAFLGYANDPEQRETINKVLASEEELTVAGHELMAISQSEDQRAKFRSRRKYETDMSTNYITGKKEGRAEEKKEVASNLKHLGLSVDKIAQATGLPIDVIEKM